MLQPSLVLVEAALATVVFLLELLVKVKKVGKDGGFESHKSGMLIKPLFIFSNLATIIGVG